MKLANAAGRATLVVGDEFADVATSSDGVFGPDVRSVYDNWDEFRAFASTVASGTAAQDLSALGCPVPEPRQVFGIGLNYRAHAEESGMAIPTVPATFTKFPACLTGPFDDVVIEGDTVDWEVELAPSSDAAPTL